MDYFIGAIIPWSADFEPYNWFFCDGRQVLMSQWQALYAVIGTRYGGDGRTYFNLPNLNGRVAVGSTAYPANTGGSETVTLTTAQIPTHGHNILANTNLNISGASTPDSSRVPGASKAGLGATQLYKQLTSSADLVSLNANTLNNFGVSGAHTNLQPYLAMRYIICVNGEYPFRP